MAINYKSIIWDITNRSVLSGFWAKSSDTGRGLRVTIAADNIILVPGTETLKIRFRAADGTFQSTAAVIVNGAFNIELDDLILNQVSNGVQADLELEVNGKIISSPTFEIPVYDSIGI